MEKFVLFAQSGASRDDTRSIDGTEIFLGLIGWIQAGKETVETGFGPSESSAIDGQVAFTRSRGVIVGVISHFQTEVLAGRGFRRPSEDSELVFCQFAGIDRICRARGTLCEASREDNGNNEKNVVHPREKYSEYSSLESLDLLHGEALRNVAVDVRPSTLPLPFISLDACDQHASRCN